ncbi:MAG: hypothetical protein GWM98_10520, partial [Nitrospinaceae bacterium]|nr:hypothetical protein [Nitrospinaceae bacterium]NIR54845.1 hypothetical protein [Nitrospinaceae bacterium]NIS85270.1 hypothetical protein [Nitrospinaceae bacterium]NIT82083.1 hypothetical protein [Nitrospinaceae bacterium]NIU44344.1 hypothetical protein [Nitrospinaceae bacterium]
CGRDLLLMQLFLTASLLGYVRLRRRGGSLWGWMGVLLLFGLSLLSKQNAVAMPALILLYEWMIRKRPLRDGRAWLRAAPFAAGVAGFFYYT